MLDAQDLHITFNPGTPIENPVLRGMTLSIPEGEFVSVIGSNGAGKSTFLNAIAGDLRVDSGTIRINHEDVTRLPTWDRSERVARVFQDPMAGTCEALTIEENMALALARGKSRRLRRAIDRQTRELFRERLSVLRLGLENRLGDRNSRTLTRTRRALSGRTLEGITLTGRHEMWNAGVIGLPASTAAERVAQALQLCDAMCATDCPRRLIERRDRLPPRLDAVGHGRDRGPRGAGGREHDQAGHRRRPGRGPGRGLQRGPVPGAGLGPPHVRRVGLGR